MGGVRVQLAGGAVRQERPELYQVVGGRRRWVAGAYRMGPSGKVSFAVGAYDARRPLVVDPVLVYSTHLGGSGGDQGNGIAVDGGGNAYVTGSTFSADFPTKNPLQAAKHGAANGRSTAFVAKLNGAGSALVYATYLGGSGDDVGTGIAVDGAGNVYVTGSTTSPDFPTKSPLQAALGGSGSGFSNAFVAKLNPTGSALVYSTYLGGSGSALVNSTSLGSDEGHGIAVDGMGNAYVTGYTYSADFPTESPLQATLGGRQNAFVAKLNAAGSALVYSTYLGGSGNFDGGHGIAVDGAGNAYVIGNTDSVDFPTKNPLQATLGGSGGNVFVAKLNTAGSALVYSTYLGGSSFFGDVGTGIAVDGAGNAYVTGLASSTDFPTKNPLQAALGGRGATNAFVAKLNAAGSALVYSTYLGGSGRPIGDKGKGITVDEAGNAYVTGDTNSADFPTKNPLQAATGGSGGLFSTAFVAKIAGGAGGPQPGAGTAQPAVAPAAPGTLTATVEDTTTVQLAWMPDPTAAGTVIDDASGDIIATTSSGQTSYTVQGLTPGSYVCFIAYAFNAAGTSGWSNWACATLPPAATPGAAPPSP